MDIQTPKYRMYGNLSMLIAPKSALEDHFTKFRKNIIGRQQTFKSPFGKKEIIYADWTATGRAYRPIEDHIQKEIMPYLGNTHTNTAITGTLMSKAYEEAKAIIKGHVNAGSEDALIFCGSGMTAAVNKLQRILGMRVPEGIKNFIKAGDEALQVPELLRPVVFVTHMEHHSNHTSWLETIADVEIINPDENGKVDMGHLKHLLIHFKNRKNKIAAVTACSNVTGIETPYHQIAKMMHEHGGLCFVDFAASAPYVDLDMHPKEKGAHLDAIYFSPHKFLGGAGTPGVLIFNKKIYKNKIPDQPGGGTLLYSNPWGVSKYITAIEQREDGGTPPILQGIKAAMCVRLKEEMGIENMLLREKELLQVVFNRLLKIPNIEILERSVKKRLGIISFMVNGAHYNLIAKILNDRFGIQVRGGCCCAGTYGHKLLNIDESQSYQIFNSMLSGDLFCKPGWIRLSIHPTMTNAEINLIMDSIELTALNFKVWEKDYVYNHIINEYVFKDFDGKQQVKAEGWFKFLNWE